ncbi:cation:proton antiporter [archaeon]|nr:cation:proton antiporter [archaeon]
MEFLLTLVLLLILAKIFGEIAERLNFPSVLGYLVAGMFLVFGGNLIGLHQLVEPSANIAIFGQLGAILLLFVAGMRELNTTHLLENKTATYASAILGFIIPAIAIALVAVNAHVIDPINFDHAIGFVGGATLVACLSVSSVVTSMKVLIKAGKLNTQVGKVVLSTGVIDALFGLAVFTALSALLPGGIDAMVPALLSIVSVAVILFVLFVVGINILPAIVKYTASLEVEEAQFTLAFVVMLALAVLVGAFNLHGVIGAFLAGIIVSRSPLRERNFSDKLASLSYGVFVPIFFAWMGMLAVTSTAEGGFSLPFWSPVMIILIAVALFGNFLGSFIGALLGKIPLKSSAIIGLAMVPRGGVGLVILAAVAKGGGNILGGNVGAFVYSSVIAVVLVSVLVSPFLILLGLREKAI